jgi:hypothetical protein
VFQQGLVEKGMLWLNPTWVEELNIQREYWEEFSIFVYLKVLFKQKGFPSWG